MFDFSSPELRVLANSILRCSGSNPAAPASQSVSNASHMKVAQKPRVPRFGAGTEIAFETHLQNLAPRAVR
jgi:hypothetical protein